MKRFLINKLLDKTCKPTSFCFIGFDGFLDQISSAVFKQQNEDFEPFSSIASFAERIASFSGKSGNIELVPRKIKIGGNGPILANALLEGGHKIALAGFFGSPKAHEIFLPLLKRCNCSFNLGIHGVSDAIEFEDGKVILGKMGDLRNSNAQTVISKMNNLQSLLDRADLFASVNWTMLPMMNALWEILLKEYIPNLKPKKRLFFVDLADPEKRSDADLEEALNLLRRFQSFYEVHLGLNRRESLRVARVLGVKETEGAALSNAIRTLLKISKVVLHEARFACDDQIIITSPFTPSPHLTTGAGDNFNAGYLNALLYGWSMEEALTLGVYTASFYVYNGYSPTRENLALFLEERLN